MDKSQIHPTAIVAPGSKVGHDSVVEAYAIIGPEVVIGDNCRIGSHAVMEYTELGNGCTVFPFASLGLPPQHMQYKGEKTKLVVGKNCTFREGVTAHRGTMFDKGVTQIGDNGFFMAYAHIAHDCVIGNNVIMANNALLAGHVEVGDNCFLSATAAAHQYVRIGKGALVSGGAMVPLDVAPFCIAQGDRAHLRGLNVVGLRRMGAPRASLKLLKDAYKTVFLNGLTLEEALQNSALSVSDPWVAAFKDFLSNKKRGFVRPEMQTSAPEAEEAAV